MIDNKEIARLRRTYNQKELSRSSVTESPFDQFKIWLNESLNAAIIDPNAFVLATCDKSGIISTRVVLLKAVIDKGFVFFSNYQSQKGRAIAENPNAAMNVFWRELERQVNIRGSVEKLTSEQSYQYFNTRPYESKIGAWASNQSDVLPNRKFLEDRFEEFKQKFPDNHVPLPDFWGGYLLKPEFVEFWQGRENRLHDRIAYIKVANSWEIKRLAP